jgi:hypothetical protein
VADQRKETALTAKKKLAGAFGGVVAIGATVALTAGTFSYFSDSATETGGGGDVEFGTLELTTLDGAAQVPFVIEDAAPGKTVIELTGNDNSICFQNTGSLNGVLRVQFVPKANPIGFNNAVLIKTAGFSDPAATALNGTHTLAENAKVSENGSVLAPMDKGRIKCIPITVSIAPGAGNELQGVTGGFTLVADLIQDVAGVQAPSFPAQPVDAS